jgi:ubiquinone/menaquinone biosynthesis C-methylase UbiE
MPSGDRRRTGTYRDDWFAERYREHWEPVLAEPAVALLDHLEAAGAAPRPGARVLDIGAGTGLLGLELARRWPAAIIVAVDPARAMLEIARDRARRAGIGNGRLEILAGPAEALPIPDQSIELAVSSFVFQLVADRPGALGEAYRVLRPGGWLGYVTWLTGDRTFAPGLAIDAALGAATDTDWTGGAPRAGDLESSEAAEIEVLEAGFVDVRVVSGRLSESWTRDRYLEYVEGCRNTIAFAGLDDRQAAELRADLRKALEAVPIEDFVQRGAVIHVLGRRPSIDPRAGRDAG